MANLPGLVGLVITALRRKKGWSQNRLARASGIPQPTVSRIEVGDADITIPQLDAISRALEVSAGRVLDTADHLRDLLGSVGIQVDVKNSAARAESAPVGETLSITGSLLGPGASNGFILGNVFAVLIDDYSRKQG